MKYSIRDIILVLATCGLCLAATWTVNYLLDKNQSTIEADRLLRRLQRDKETKDKLKLQDDECVKCRVA